MCVCVYIYIYIYIIYYILYIYIYYIYVYMLFIMYIYYACNWLRYIKNVNARIFQVNKLCVFIYVHLGLSPNFASVKFASLKTKFTEIEDPVQI